MNWHDAARFNESIIHEHMVFHRRTIAAWIYGNVIWKAMTA